MTISINQAHVDDEGSVFVFVKKIAPKQEDILGEALIVIVVMIIVVMIAMFVLMMVMKMMTAKQTTIVTVTAFDTAMMIQTVME